MSRQYNARLRGAIEVEMVCDECGKKEWIKVEPTVDDLSVEYEAAQRSETWGYADDCLVCSDKCSQAIWNDTWYEGAEFDG